MHVTIATPMYGGMCAGAFAKSLVNTMNILGKAGIEVSFIDLYNESLITRARNTLTHMFLQSKSDYLLFIDADQTFRPGDIVRMLSHDKELIGAPVPMKSIRWDGVRQAALDGKENLEEFSGIYNINFLPGFFNNGNKVKLSDPIEVLYVGTGMMLIKREVFEKIADKVQEYTYDGSPMKDLNIMPGQTKIKDYWATGIVNDRLLSEDYNFCNLWREVGGKIYVDILAKVIHIGTYYFAGNIFDKSVLDAAAEKQEEEEPETPKKKAKK